MIDDLVGADLEGETPPAIARGVALCAAIAPLVERARWDPWGLPAWQHYCAHAQAWCDRNVDMLRAIANGATGADLQRDPRFAGPRRAMIWA